MAERKKFLLDELVGPRTALGLPVPIYSDTGFTDSPRDHLMSMYGRLNPTKWHTYFNDFDDYTTGDWTITSTGSPTHALDDIDGGALKITDSAGSGDLDMFQLVKAGFYTASGKQMFFRTRFKIDDATLCGFQVGLQITNTDCTAPSDGIFFTKSASVTTVTLKTIAAAASNSSTGTIATMVADTFVTLTFYYDGYSYLACSLNDGVWTTLATTNVPASTIKLNPTFGIKTGSAVARIMTLDYILAAKQR